MLIDDWSSHDTPKHLDSEGFHVRYTEAHLTVGVL